MLASSAGPEAWMEGSGAHPQYDISDDDETGDDYDSQVPTTIARSIQMTMTTLTHGTTMVIIDADKNRLNDDNSRMHIYVYEGGTCLSDHIFFHFQYTLQHFWNAN